MIVIAGSTGMRFAELLGLTWENVDLEKGTIKVKRAWDYLDTNNFAQQKMNNLFVMYQ